MYRTIMFASAVLLLGCEMQKASKTAIPQPSPAAETVSETNTQMPVASEQSPVLVAPSESNSVPPPEAASDVCITTSVSATDAQTPMSVEQKHIAQPQVLPSDSNSIAQNEIITEVATTNVDGVTADISKKPPKPTSFEIFVRDAAETNLKLMEGGYGTIERPVVINGGASPNYIKFEIVVEREGDYNLYATFAAQNARPFSVIVDEKIVLANVGDKVTKGLGPGDEEKILLGKLTLKEGANRVTLKWPDGYPCSHLSSISLDK